VGTAACGGAGSAPKGPQLVAADFRFQPSDLTLAGGRQVTLRLTNKGRVRHNLSVPSIPVDVDLEPEQATNVIFVLPATAGPVEFFCKIHRDGGMRGTFHVQL
jgi:plastocyanin